MSGMDAAWSQAESALAAFVRRQAKAHRDEEWGKPEDWSVSVRTTGKERTATAWVYDPSTDSAEPIMVDWREDGATPAEALRALASRLTSER